MLTSISKIKLLFSLTLAVTGILTGCNAMYSARLHDPDPGSLPASFHILQQNNMLMAAELMKLPEIQDGISDSEKPALENMVQLYMSEPDSFNAAFKQMYRVGIPGVRKYCSPLQALFWLAEDGHLSAQNNPLINYSLKAILIAAWQIDYCRPDLTDAQVVNIVESIQDQTLQKQFKQIIGDGIDKYDVRAIFTRYESNPNMFSQSGQKIILKALRIRKTLDPRWNDFDAVVERLNSPELIDFYQKRNFRALNYASYGINGGPASAPEKIFIRKSGNCDAFTAFTIHCLRRAGYEAWPELLKDKHHITTLFKTEQGIFILDNAWFYANFTGLFGPYNDRKAALDVFR